MDNTELHYVSFDPDAIWSSMIDNYIEAGGDVLYPGDEKEMLLRSVQADIVQAFGSVDTALRMQTLRYAVGTYLDVIGENRGCERLEGDYATVDVKITTKNTGRVVTLESGSVLTPDGNIYYATTEDIVFDGTQQTIYTTLKCETLGEAGNGLASGVALTLIVPNSSVATIVTTSAAGGGEDEEDDESYRERIRNHGLASVTTGPIRQYKEVAMGVSAEIIDVNVISPSAGKVNVYLLLDDMTRTTLVAKVQETLSADDVRPLTDEVTVALATKIDYKIYVNYSLDSSINDSNLTDAVNEYIEWQNSSIGMAFNPDRLMALLYTAGASRVTFANNSVFNGSSNIAYTEIASNKYCSGTVVLTKN